MGCSRRSSGCPASECPVHFRNQRRGRNSPGVGRPRLQSSPPRRDAWMFLFGHLIRRDFLVDALHEGGRGDVGDRIGLADQPAGRLQRFFHLVQQHDQSGPRRVALFLGVGFARGAQPGLLPLLARDVLELLGEFLVRPLRRGLRQMVLPVEDDEIADQPVDVPDPVAHLGALVGRIRPERRSGKRLVEIFADRAALVQRPAVMDQRRDHAERIDLQIFRRMMLHRWPCRPRGLHRRGPSPRGTAGRGAKRSNASRGEGSSWSPPEADGPVFLSGVWCHVSPAPGKVRGRDAARRQFRRSRRYRMLCGLHQHRDRSAGQ